MRTLYTILHSMNGNTNERQNIRLRERHCTGKHVQDSHITQRGKQGSGFHCTLKSQGCGPDSGRWGGNKKSLEAFWAWKSWLDAVPVMCDWGWSGAYGWKSNTWPWTRVNSGSALTDCYQSTAADCYLQHVTLYQFCSEEVGLHQGSSEVIRIISFAKNYVKSRAPHKLCYKKYYDNTCKLRNCTI